MMFRCVAIVAGLVLFSGSAYGSEPTKRTFITDPVSSSEARDHIGQNRIVCGQVKKVNLKKYGAFINMGNWETLPNGTVILSPSFTAILWENDRVNLKINPKEEFLGHSICFSGVISSSPTNRYTTRSIPQITIKNLNQIKNPEVKNNN